MIFLGCELMVFVVLGRAMYRFFSVYGSLLVSVFVSLDGCRSGGIPVGDLSAHWRSLRRLEVNDDWAVGHPVWELRHSWATFTPAHAIGTAHERKQFCPSVVPVFFCFSLRKVETVVACPFVCKPWIALHVDASYGSYRSLGNRPDAQSRRDLVTQMPMRCSSYSRQGPSSRRLAVRNHDEARIQSFLEKAVGRG